MHKVTSNLNTTLENLQNLTGAKDNSTMIIIGIIILIVVCCCLSSSSAAAYWWFVWRGQT